MQLRLLAHSTGQKNANNVDSFQAIGYLKHHNLKSVEALCFKDAASRHCHVTVSRDAMPHDVKVAR